MNDVTKNEPVDNSHLDGGIAAREIRQAQKPEEVAESVTEEVEEVEQEEAQNNPEESAATESGDTPAQQSRKKPGVHQRIDELTKEKHDARRAAEDAQRERDYWREQATRQATQQEVQPTQAAVPSDGEPTLESCDFDVVDFQRKYFKWMRAQEKQQEAEQERTRVFLEKEAAFRADYPDYDTVTRNPALPITQAVVDVILETDDPPAVAYYLGQNLNEAAAIAQMTPHQIGRAIGRIEAKLSAPKASEAPRQVEPKTVTKAPAPVTTLSGAPAVKKSYDEMSPKEYDEVRRKERAGKGS